MHTFTSFSIARIGFVATGILTISEFMKRHFQALSPQASETEERH